jgi:hypothetical protein
MENREALCLPVFLRATRRRDEAVPRAGGDKASCKGLVSLAVVDKVVETVFDEILKVARLETVGDHL